MTLFETYNPPIVLSFNIMPTLSLLLLFAVLLLNILHTNATGEPTLISFSRCGLVNNIDGAQVYEFATERENLNNYHDKTFQDFVLERSALVFDLDYCRFDVGNVPVVIDVLCDQGTDCTCSVYYQGTKCASCSMCMDEVTADGKFPISPVAFVAADCSGISDDYPSCQISCDGGDPDGLPDVEGCFDLTTGDAGQLAGPSYLLQTSNAPTPSPVAFATGQKAGTSSARSGIRCLLVTMLASGILTSLLWR